MRNTEVIPGQIPAIAQLRWRMFVNGLRSRRGKMELASRIIVSSAFAFGGVSGFAAAIGVSWYLTSQDKIEFLAAVLWLIFVFWQLFPVTATAFTNNPDSSDLLRFPLAYRAYFLIRLVYGYLDPASALGSVFIIGMLIGITVAKPLLFPWALVVLVVFGLFNLLLMQMIFAWLERWLAQRRTREILGMLFILFMLSFQLIGPAIQQLEGKPHPEFRRDFEIAARIQAFLPPGLAAEAIARVSHRELLGGFACLVGLAALSVAIGLLLHLRIRAQFHGENLSEAAARPIVKQLYKRQVGWDLPGFSGSVAAVFEKETRYLARSGPMLLTIVMPIFMLAVFRFGPMNAARHSAAFTRTPDIALPGAAAYALLILTNLVYNSFGGDGGGIQFFYASPVTFRQIVLGKNLTHAAVLLANSFLAWVAVAYLYGPPHLSVVVATIAGILFAAPLNFSAGNLLSIYTPKKRDFATFGRQNVSQTTVLASFGVQIVIFGVGAGVFALARLFGNLWIAAILFLVLSAVSIPAYILILRQLDSLAIQKRETLIAELCRA